MWPAPTNATTGNSSPLLACMVSTLMVSAVESKLPAPRLTWCGRPRWRSTPAHSSISL
jgi:hypothetical protein